VFGGLWQAMRHDKKVVGGTVMGVWPVRIGEVVIRPLEEDACAEWFRARAAHPKSSKPAARKPSRWQ
jgi:3-dehydroquinate synthase